MSQPRSHENPFPGMNPYMEDYWENVHVVLLSAIQEALTQELPDDLLARAEERVEMIESPDSDSSDDWTRQDFRADVAVSERWRQGLPPVWQPGSEQAGGVAVMEPEFHPVVAVENKQRWLEIRDTKGFVITVIEVLSPSNKDQHRNEYTERRQSFIEAGANYVEIDLLRGGRPLFAAPRDQQRPYSVAVYRVTRPERFELYRVGLRDRLPCFRVPLRPRDADVPLDLQPLINRVYASGRYWLNDFAETLTPALSEADYEWSQDLLRMAGLL